MSVTLDFYVTQADSCARDAAAADLPNVRERSLRAEAAWRTMADRHDRSEKLRSAHAAEKQLSQDIAAGED
ncbi:hypothetical protein FHS31_000097 [Sphingomonas vulcanisoli]|uniref:Uncharacterized protein n=1 Tax=Sphingomonas vulcanisoli TaxID=1658060 RepID=A0ABX0TPG9_9SPHN|nr:hypothetical protein [Sphingomonas vulcanisoli]NIJ06515.1 hypothetical protein [Sphingomonas vulcanisoli]